MPDYVEPDEDIFPMNEPSQPSYSTQSAPVPPPAQPTAAKYEKSHMFLINFYRRYFDLDSDVFFDKIFKTLFPFRWSAEDSANEVLELYGFIWITGTLVFLMFVSNTGSNIIGQWLHGKEEVPAYNYNFDLIFKLMGLFYGYNLFVPIVLCVWTRWVTKFPEPISLLQVVSIYGYTNILWIPITLLNFVFVVLVLYEKHSLLLNVLEWVVVVLLGIITGMSNLSKVAPMLKKNCVMIHTGDAAASRKIYLPLMIGLAVAHLGFTVLVKWSYFGIKV